MALQSDSDEVFELLLAPFREIAHKPLIAFDGAGGSDGKGRVTAEALSQAGKRALNHLGPLCEKVYRKHGMAFISFIRSDGKAHKSIVFVYVPLLPPFASSFLLPLFI